ncbi:MAG: GGDEF domain-containing protein [Nitrosomonadales bacterium]|nr:GGDEF domain-containing protein [Nitrosomonadales bacterium]
MTRFSVQRYRAAVLRMYLRIAVLLALPLSALYYLMDETPDRGLVSLLFALFVMWLRWHTRHDSEESLYYVNWFVLATLCLMLYGAFISNEQLRQEIWVMIFPIVFAPVVAARERIVWAIAGAVAIVAVMLLRPEMPTPLTVLVHVIAYLTLSFITMMLVRHNEQNIERLAHLTIIDPLTKAYCRGYLNEVLTGEINRCKRSGQPLTLIMLDIDHFKMINDDHGHLYGDNVLEQVAAALKHAAKRAGDHVFRYGGEEFCILTSGLDRGEAWQFAEKLRLGVSALDIECARSPHRHLTASVGFWCVSNLREITPTALLLNADNALYRAKAAGRNTVVDFDSIPAGEEGVGRAVVVSS